MNDPVEALIWLLLFFAVVCWLLKMKFLFELIGALFRRSPKYEPRERDADEVAAEAIRRAQRQSKKRTMREP